MRPQAAHPPQHSPWGVVQDREEIADGIWFVSTASHGGIWLSPRRRASVPSYLVPENFLKSDQWWEEDCDQAWVWIIFGRELGRERRERAKAAMLHYKPGNYYASVRNAGGQARCLAGPFRDDHKAALDIVERAKEIAFKLDPRAPWYAYGTLRTDYGYDKPGILNERLGL